MMPGDPEIAEALRRTSNGIPLGDVLWSDFTRMATELHVDLPIVVETPSD